MHTTHSQRLIAALSPDQRREARLARDLTQYQVALACGVQIDTVRTWERGISMPLPERATLYAAALGLETMAGAQ